MRGKISVQKIIAIFSAIMMIISIIPVAFISATNNEVLAKTPELTVKSINGDILENGATVNKNVIVSQKYIDENQITVTKDDNDCEMPKGGIFTENGRYVITVNHELLDATISFSFTISKSLPRNKSYNFFNNKIDDIAEIKKQGSYITEETDSTKPYYGSKYFTHLKNGNNLKASFDWYSEKGFEYFAVFTRNEIKKVNEYLNIDNSYELSASSNGEDFDPIEYTCVGSSNLGTGYIKYELVATYIPADAKYIRVTLKNPSNDGQNWRIGLAGAEYETPLAAPVLSLKAETTYGETLVLKNNDVSRWDVTLTYDYLLPSEITVLKDGSSFELPENGVFTENGAYTIFAENEINKGDPIVFSFTINKPLLFNISYDFRENHAEEIINNDSNITSGGNSKTEDTAQMEGYHGSKYYTSLNGDSAWFQWKSETGFYSFTVFTKNFKTDFPDYLNAEKCYELSWSADGESFEPVEYVCAGSEDIGTGYKSFKLVAPNIPSEAKYIRLTLSNPINIDNWKIGLAGVEYEIPLAVPVLNVKVKTAYGYNIDLKNNGVAFGDVILSYKHVLASDIIVKKDGSEISLPENGVLTEGGKYIISAENTLNEGNPVVVSFTIDKSSTYKKAYNLSDVNIKNIDEIKKSGKYTVEEKINTTNENGQLVDKITANGGKYLTCLGNGDNQIASFDWYSKNGFKSFAVFTKNENSGQLKYLNLKENYQLSWSEDGVNFENQSLEYQAVKAAKIGNNVSYALIAYDIPTDARYIRVTLKNPINDGKNWRIGLGKVEFEVPLEVPDLNLKVKTIYSNVKLNNNDKAGSDVIFSYDYVSASDIIVKKDGSKIDLPENCIFTQNGVYTISATNNKGSSSITFTLARVNDSEKYLSKYDFDGEKADAEKAYQSLISSPTIDNAPADFSNGDGSVTINNESKLNDKWWSPEDGGSKLTLGTGSNYSENGYFYFKNSGTSGEKFTGISFTYSVAAKENFPKNQRIIVSVADSYDGNFKKLSPISHTEVSTLSGSMVNMYTDVYYFGETDKIVKIEYKANTLISARWHASALALFNLNKLPLPIINVKSVTSNTNIEYNGVSLTDVSYSISNAYNSELFNYEILLNGEPYNISGSNGVLTQDGEYVIKANNIIGECEWRFTIAKDSPAIVLRDKTGAALGPDSIQDDDVTVSVFNAEKITITRDGQQFEMPENGILDLNGKYVIIAEYSNGKKAVKTVTIARELPSVTVLDYDGRILTNGVVSKTYIDVVIKNADTVVVKKNKSQISMPEENHFIENGKYSIEAINKAGKVEFNFVIDIAPSLKNMKHTGDTVEVVDYDTGSKTSIYQFATNYMTSANFPASALAWIGINRSMLRPEKTALKTSVVYRCNNFKTFGVWAILNPEIPDLSNYKIYASTDGLNFKEISYSIEKDESYITQGTPTQNGYSRYRLIAKNIPKGTNYIKIEIDSQHKLAHAYGIQKVEFSFNKKDQGTIDFKELEGILSNSNDGIVIPIILRNDSKPIPASVFEAFEGCDVTLKLIIVDEDLNPIFCYKINGSKIYTPGDMEITVKYNTATTLGAYDDVRLFTVPGQGEWDMDVTFGVYMKGSNYTEYYLYQILDGTLSSPIKTFIDGDCVYFSMTPGQGYFLAREKGINKDMNFINSLGLDKGDSTFDSQQENIDKKDDVNSNLNDTTSDKIVPIIVKLAKEPILLLLTIVFASVVTCAILTIVVTNPKKIYEVNVK